MVEGNNKGKNKSQRMEWGEGCLEGRMATNEQMSQVGFEKI